jgi:H+/Cl- antiporter ClcA
VRPDRGWGAIVAVVRAPITGAVLVTEMAGNLTHFPAFILVSMVATLVADAARRRPIYELLLEQVAPGKPVEKVSPPEAPNH